MKKKAILALLLAMTMLLSGCALIKKDAAVDAARVILSYNGTDVTKAQVQAQTNYELQQMAYMYSMYYGSSYDTTDPANIAAAQESAVNNIIRDLVLKAHVQDMKIEEKLSEDNLKEIRETAQSDYDYALTYARTQVDQTLEGDALEEAAKAYLDERQVSLEAYEEDAKQAKLLELLRAEVVKDVTVSDEDVQKEYDSRVESAKGTYEGNPVGYADAANSGTVYYAPAGVRRVKQILLKFPQENQTAITDANTKVTQASSKVTAAQQILDDADAPEEDKTKAQADLEAAQAELEEANKAVTEATDAAYAAIDAEADEVLKQLKDGADWETLMAEKTQDPGMQAGRETAETGYAVAEGMTSFDSAFVDAAMALKAVGDVSDKTRGSSNGYYIIKYFADQAEGAIPLDTVKDTLHDTLLSSKQTSHYNETVDAWVAEAGIKADMNALKD